LCDKRTATKKSPGLAGQKRALLVGNVAIGQHNRPIPHQKTLKKQIVILMRIVIIARIVAVNNHIAKADAATMETRPFIDH
jgi:hypothetical protein